jgi:NAD-dependent deacetylase
MDKIYKECAKLIKEAKNAVVFTGAGISVESGIPPFRGENGLWTKYDPKIATIDYFYLNPTSSWKFLKEIFYKYIENTTPNPAHYTIAKWEKKGLIKCVVTQNIDFLHQTAGSKNVYEIHGTLRYLRCDFCENRIEFNKQVLDTIPVMCIKCGKVMRPDIVFFGEMLYEPDTMEAFNKAKESDLIIVVGSTGEVMPAALIPKIAKENGAKIIEINPEKTNFTKTITDIHIKEKATIGLKNIDTFINNKV